MTPQECHAPKGLAEGLYPAAALSILRLPAVLKARGLSRSTHYEDIKQGLFTKPVSLGLRSVGWPEYEVSALLTARISGRSENEIRALVARLHAERGALG